MRRHVTAWCNAALMLGVVLALTLGAANHLGTLETAGDRGAPAASSHSTPNP